MEKGCSRCGESKPISEFLPRNGRMGSVNSYCRPCANAIRREWRASNRDRESATRAAHRAANAERLRSLRLEKYRREKDLINAKRRSKKKPVTPELRDYMRAYRAANSERLSQARRQWDADHPERTKEQSRAKYDRLRQDPSWRLRRVIHAGMWKALKGMKGLGRWFDLLDYSVEELRTHIERQFLKGMSWDNFGEWHVDHIVPLASFSISGPNDPELRRAWALTNLRPLWGVDNMSKGAKITTLL